MGISTDCSADLQCDSGKTGRTQREKWKEPRPQCKALVTVSQSLENAWIKVRGESRGKQAGSQDPRQKEEAATKKWKWETVFPAANQEGQNSRQRLRKRL